MNSPSASRDGPGWVAGIRVTAALASWIAWMALSPPQALAAGLEDQTPPPVHTTESSRPDGTRDALALAEAEALERLRSAMRPVASEPSPREFVLTLNDALVHYAVAAQVDPTGIRREDAVLSLCRFGNGWKHPALHSPSRELDERLDAGSMDVTTLSWDGHRIQGVIATSLGRFNATRDFGEGENMHSALKAQRKAVMNWHLGGEERIARTPVRIVIDGQVLANQAVVELELKGFAGDQRTARPPASTDAQLLTHQEADERSAQHRHSLFIRGIAAGNRWLEVSGQTPHWNRALHDVDLVAVTLGGERIEGRLEVELLPDPWVPGADGSGKRTRRMTCRVKATIEVGLVTGEYEAAGDQGEFRGAITGRIWQPVEGTFAIESRDGSWDGQLHGQTRMLPGSVEELDCLRLSPLPEVPGVALRDEVAEAMAAYRRSHAALLALAWLPVASEAGFKHALAMPSPIVDGPATNFITDLARYVRANIPAAPAPVTGPVASDDPDFGPFVGDKFLDGNQLPERSDPSAPQDWRILTRWRTIGPIEQQGALQVHAAILPLIVPTDGVSYAVARPKLERTIPLRRSWVRVQQTNAVLHPDPASWADTWPVPERFGPYGRYPATALYYAHQNAQRSYRWYALSELTSSTAQQVWLAVRAADFGRLWINGRLVWNSGPDHDPRSVNVLPVALRVGLNEILVESGRRHINYFPPAPWDRSGLTVWACVQGAPRTAEEIERATRIEQKAYAEQPPQVLGYFGNTARVFPEAKPPVDWGLEKGVNVIWKTAVGAGSSAPVRAGDRLFVTASGGNVLCVEESSGRVLWQQSLGDTETTTTPIIAGDRLWIVNGHHAACFSLSGKLLWQTPLSAHEREAVSSDPVMIGETLVCLAPVAPAPGEKEWRRAVAALEAVTGVERWRSEVLPGSASGGLAAVALHREGRTRFCIVTADGFVLDGDNGRTLFRHCFDLADPITPMVEENQVYFAARNLGQAALRLWLDEAGRVGCRKLWEIRRGGTSSPQQTALGLVDDGRLYLPRSADENGGHHPVAWDQLDVYEVARGQHLARPNPVIANAASPLPLVKAGEFLVVSDSGRRGYGQNQPQAAVAFVTAGDRPYLRQRVVLERGKLEAAPVFAGDRMYLRVDQELVCIGGGEPSQQTRDLEALARQMVNDIGFEPRDRVLDIEPLSISSLPVDAPVNRLIPNVPPERWLIAGPVPRVEGQGLPGIRNTAQWIPRPGGALELGGQRVEWVALPDGICELRGMTPVFLEGDTFYRPTSELNISAAVRKQSHRTVCFGALLQCDRDLCVRFRAAGASGWLSGQAVGEEMPVRLRRGLHSLILRVHVAQVPPFGKIAITPRFSPIVAPERLRAAWLDRIRVRRTALEEMRSAFGERGHGLRAGKLLEALDDVSNQDLRLFN